MFFQLHLNYSTNKILTKPQLKKLKFASLKENLIQLELLKITTPTPLHSRTDTKICLISQNLYRSLLIAHFIN